MTTEQVYNINQAAKLTGYTIPTIRARLPKLKKLGARQDGKVWLIPESALYGAGLMVKVVSKPESETLLSPTINEIGELREKLSDALRRAEVAEAINRERERLIETQALALRMLEAKQPSRRAWFNRD